jgi:hypothetical protein
MEKNKSKRKVKLKKKSFCISFKWLFLFILSTQFLLLSAQTPTINLSIKNVSLHEILIEIKKQSEKNMVYNNNLIEKYNNETIELKNVTLEEALKTVLEGKKLKYKLIDHIIVIEPSDEGQKTIDTNTLYQTLKGNVFDIESNSTLPGATIIIVGTNPIIGTSTDANGNYKIEKVPLGRYNIQITYIGYETQIIREILINSGKEAVVNTGLKQSVTSLDEVKVKSNSSKEQPLNSMSTLSARQFSVEETQRYAGGFDDPSRLASAFAGVASPDVESNGIIVRGNSPTGAQWKVEGVEVPNPNHFAGSKILGGGFVSFFSNQLLANSDFLTGAFPAEYGNALSAVFDIKLRNGNSDKHEFAFQTGLLGIEGTAEGPVNREKQSSYLINYRYSTFGLVKNFYPEVGLPTYQDLCFKLNFPTKAGSFSFWGTGAVDDFLDEADNNPSNWNMMRKRQEQSGEFNTAITGLTHKYLFNNNLYINSALAYSIDNKQNKMRWLNDNLNFIDQLKMNNTEQQITLSTFLNKKFNARHTNRTGIVIKDLIYNYDIKLAPSKSAPLENAADENGSSNLYQFYTESKINITSKFLTNVGFNFMFFDLNGSNSFEPRIGFQWQAFRKVTFGIAYGKHSRIQELGYYFFKDTSENSKELPNKDIDFTRSNHFVASFDYKINENSHLKIEPYFQYIYDVPVANDSSFSSINTIQYKEIESKLYNKGIATNLGIDVTLERFLQNGYYYMFTASLFDSRYKGGDKIERNTRFNKGYIANILGGKEWVLNTNGKNKIIGVNGRLYFYGGDWQSEVDTAASLMDKRIEYNEARAFTDQLPSTLRIDIGFTYRINKAKYSNVFSLQVLNILGSVISYNQDVDFVKNEIIDRKVRSVFPSASWRIEF